MLIKISRYFFLAIAALMIARCGTIDAPVTTEWIDLSSKDGMQAEKLFKTAGKGVGLVSWWAGGYTWPQGAFRIELIDVKKNKPLLQKTYAYGDTTNGSDELPRFKWWHSEEKDRIILQANRVYKMTFTAVNLAQPGAGWGLWLYEIGTPPKRRADAKTLESH